MYKHPSPVQCARVMPLPLMAPHQQSSGHHTAPSHVGAVQSKILVCLKKLYLAPNVIVHIK